MKVRVNSPVADAPEVNGETEADAAADDGTVQGSAGAPSTTAADDAASGASEAEEWKDRYLRAMAEMDNVRRRARMEADEGGRRAREVLISDLLPILDNFTRALEAASQTEDFEALRGGVELIHRQLTDMLERAGLERIEALGQPFDPNIHEAIMQVPAQEGQGPHEVAEELRPGYRLQDRVIRPTLVKVTSG